ncbi:serine/threonine protein kinase [Deinococcus seoulensis]|uniref:Serine/threonine protein kinase n=3 Tax=Deinococcaceae TaxID=183710 RepID=A0ABQ2RKL3_9DEIO|nr:serine/threonine protein kinase [Deinococcus seoulensis]GGS24148.1 serine/threonine protein kinase [Deinococcus knuensis]
MQEFQTTQPLSNRAPLAEQPGVYSESAEWCGQPVFVKTLAADDPDSLARFQHEGRVAASLRHPLIVSPLAITPTQLIFPFVEGGTLRERLERGPLDEQQATEVASGVLCAVTYLHAQGVTHHDLKPENVMLLGGQPRWNNVRLIDFGMSHSRALPLDIHSGTRMGTPHFMAPEQFLGVRGDPRSDLYSVGVLLFDCLAGHPPYEDALGWLAGIRDRRAELPGPEPLHPLMRSALSRDRAQRPLSAAEMQHHLTSARLELNLPPLPLPTPDAAAAPATDTPA